MSAAIVHCYAIRTGGGLFGDYGEIIAAATFSIPPARWGEDVIELSRLVRSPECQIPLTKLISFACSHLKRNGRDLVVSYADQTQNHHGGIYQACSWNYHGIRSRRSDGILKDGIFIPARSCNQVWGTRSIEKLRRLFPSNGFEEHFDMGKHLYWKALTRKGEKQAARMGLKKSQYPKPGKIQDQP